MAQQTAVEWYIEKMNEYFDNASIHCGLNKDDEIYIQAKAMEKEQISEAYRQSVEEDVWNNPLRTGDEYYNEKYNSSK
jgi:hypothetical protein